MFNNFIIILTGYIVGSIPTGYIIAKNIAKININEVGSGNIGATNVTRVLGKKYGALTLLGDGLKALLYMLILTHIYQGPTKPVILCVTGFSILLGNCYSVFLSFNGGKGGVTTYGVFLALAPISALVSISSYIAICKTVKVSAIGTLSSVIILPVSILLFNSSPYKIYFITLAISFAIIVWIRHKKNIIDLISP